MRGGVTQCATVPLFMREHTMRAGATLGWRLMRFTLTFATVPVYGYRDTMYYIFHTTTKISDSYHVTETPIHTSL